MNSKPKAIIVIDNLHTGGVASSLYNYLKVASDYVDCDLLVFNPDSVNKEKLPQNVNILIPSKALSLLGMTQNELKTKSKLLALLRGGFILLSRVFSGEAVRKCIFLFVKKIKGNYDFAISYAQDDAYKSLSKGCNDFVIHKINASKKACFVHCDYANFGGYHKNQQKLLSRFTNIICVSNSCVKSFYSKFPSLESKTITCENFTDIEGVIKGAKPVSEYPENAVNFVSVCRLSMVKGLLRTVDVFKALNNEGISNFSWTIVGDGPLYSALLDQINSAGLSEKISLVGNKENPYPYIKNASALLLPSFHEAAPMVYGESAALGVPIVTTETCSAVELVNDRNIGVVLENSGEGIYKGIKSILLGETDLTKFKINKNTINQNATEQFLKFIFG